MVAEVIFPQHFCCFLICLFFKAQNACSSRDPRAGLVPKPFTFLHPKPSELCLAVRQLQVESNLSNAAPGSAGEAERGGNYYLKTPSHPLLRGCPFGGQDTARCGRLREAAAGLCYRAERSHNRKQRRNK